MDLQDKDLFRLDKRYIRPAADVLEHAFHNYPLSKFFYPDESQRRKANRYFSTISLYFGIRFGEVYAPSPHLEGIAVWVPSEYFALRFRDLLRAVPLFTLLGFAPSRALRMAEAGEYMTKVHQRLAPFKHLYLLELGVDPQFQSKGYAGKLLRPMLKRAEQEKLPCYLETNDATDVAIYKHLGFKVLEESDIPNTNVKNWAMLKGLE